MHTSVNMYKVASWEMKSNKEMSPPLQYDAYRSFVAKFRAVETGGKGALGWMPPLQILANMLTLFQIGGTIMPTALLLPPLDF